MKAVWKEHSTADRKDPMMVDLRVVKRGQRWVGHSELSWAGWKAVQTAGLKVRLMAVPMASDWVVRWADWTDAYLVVKLECLRAEW